MRTRRKPTRKDLLIVIGRLQDLVGLASAEYSNDRDPNGFEKGQATLRDAHVLCIDVLSHDPPLEPKGPWAI